MRVKKGDEVVVRTGKWAGHRATVIKALPATDQVVLDGVNIAKRHTKPSQRNASSGPGGVPQVEPGAVLAAADGRGPWPHSVYALYWPRARADSFSVA